MPVTRLVIQRSKIQNRSMCIYTPDIVDIVKWPCSFLDSDTVILATYYQLIIIINGEWSVGVCGGD